MRFDPFTDALPVRVIAELLAIPEAERTRFQELSCTIARGMDRFYGTDDVASGLREIGAYFMGLVTARAEVPGGDDLVGRLLGAEHHGDRLTPLEVVALCTALVFGGHETNRQPDRERRAGPAAASRGGRAPAGRRVARGAGGRGVSALR